MAEPGGDDLPFVYSGSLIVQGQGAALVKATGALTQIGKIGKPCKMSSLIKRHCKRRL
jgi:Ca2+-transporting ATPase